MRRKLTARDWLFGVLICEVIGCGFFLNLGLIDLLYEDMSRQSKLTWGLLSAAGFVIFSTVLTRVMRARARALGADV
jgi:drug/metabolite transporter (DMT)-like permease